MGEVKVSEDEVEFSGRVERVERDGFGIVRFDRTIGGAEYGFFTERTENLPGILPSLGVGTRVVGTCRDEGGDARPVYRIGLSEAVGGASGGAKTGRASSGFRGAFGGWR